MSALSLGRAAGAASLDALQAIAAVCAVGLAAIAISFDFATWIELDVSIAFTIPLLIAFLSRSRKPLWTLTAILVAATFVIYSRQIAPGGFYPHETFFVDRVMSSATLLAVALVLAARMRGPGRRASRRLPSARVR